METLFEEYLVRVLKLDLPEFQVAFGSVASKPLFDDVQMPAAPTLMWSLVPRTGPWLWEMRSTSPATRETILTRSFLTVCRTASELPSIPPGSHR